MQTRAASGNGAAPSANGDGEYDYDLFTIGAGSGGVRASRFAASTYGASGLCCCVAHYLLPVRQCAELTDASVVPNSGLQHA